jgi:hypothetical protein
MSLIRSLIQASATGEAIPSARLRGKYPSSFFCNKAFQLGNVPSAPLGSQTANTRFFRVSAHSPVLAMARGTHNLLCFLVSAAIVLATHAPKARAGGADAESAAFEQELKAKQSTSSGGAFTDAAPEGKLGNERIRKANRAASGAKVGKGFKVKVLKEEGGQAQVQDLFGEQGWVPKDALE